MTAPAQANQAPVAIILAAGKGTRMRSDLPKVVHPIGGRPMVCNVVDACRQAGCARVVLVVGYKQEVVRDLMAQQGPAWNAGLEYAVQAEQLGTGHAVQSARGNFEKDLTSGAAAGTPCIVLAGDGPLIRAETLTMLLDRHRSRHASASLATSVIADPTGYGRIVRDSNGRLAGIVEHKECTPEQLALREVNPSYYCFDLAELFAALKQVQRNPQSGEYYITDVPSMLMKQGRTVEVIDAVPPEDVLSINTPEQLAEVDAIYRGRGGANHGKAGAR
jgi:bifunctional UDP-N-acetylglucosamine pyrophosphorylase/glucosamine-1-phosphate N-acetyltransferase